MPALTIASDIAPLDAQATSPAANHIHERDSSETPSYSPITPVLPSAIPASTSTICQHTPPQPSSTFIPQPSTASLSESENADAIALRSAISILQMQRQQSLRDLQTLEKQKHDAVADPKGFAGELTSGRISMTESGVPVDLSARKESITVADTTLEDRSSDSEECVIPTQSSRFGSIPVPQNIVRCPPVNWAKYHVVGESLDKLHDEQRLRPLPGEPQRDEPQRRPAHVVAAPYRPFLDKIVDPPMRTRSVSKKG
ncbi:MAG: hypothetical protein M1830_000714 [Pleopsidium flavum]|nr:MAG: hypothetical protein M1830_000714 [Pleopsidium flavum]